MNVYDFDNTIYKGESTFDFYLFCVKHHPKCIKFLFTVLTALVKYKKCRMTEDELMLLAEKYVLKFLKYCPDIQELSELFCEKKFKRIKKFYFDSHKDDDIVVSASFGFVLRPFLERLGVKNALTSEVDLVSCKIKQLCYRKNKVRLFNEKFGNIHVDDVYTDSMNDKPLMSLAERSVFLVDGNKIVKLDVKGNEYE